MSDTPRTDAALQNTGDPGGSNTTAVFVFASFARTLERETDALKKLVNLYNESDRFVEGQPEALKRHAELKAEIHRLTAIIDRLNLEMVDLRKDKERMDWLLNDPSGSLWSRGSIDAAMNHT